MSWGPTKKSTVVGSAGWGVVLPLVVKQVNNLGEALEALRAEGFTLTDVNDDQWNVAFGSDRGLMFIAGNKPHVVTTLPAASFFCKILQKHGISHSKSRTGAW